MSPAAVLTAKRAVPFRPFRLVVSDGRGYDVRRPEFCMVLPSSVLVGVMKYEDDELPERVVHLHPDQIEDLVPLGSAATATGGTAAGTNGPPA